MRLLVLVLSTIAIMAGNDLARAERRVAFVAGNGAYRNMGALPNAPASARAVSGLLRTLGFELVEAIDLPRVELDGRLREFAGKTAGADVALFYYSGQAVGIGDDQYLFAVDADIKPLEDVTQGGAMNLAALLHRTMGDAGLKLVFVDASLDNPGWMKSPATRTTATINNLDLSTPGNLIVFATESGRTAPDGPAGGIRPFTQALVSSLSAPGIDVLRAVANVRTQIYSETRGRQTVWAHSNLVGVPSLGPAASPK